MRHIVEDCHGYIWITTLGGVSRFDGEDFRTFITADGLASDSVWSVFEDRRGHMWFSTSRGGVSRYDGQVFQPLTAEDGLAGDLIRCMLPV